jgi:arylsulfatase A-like enzyme
MLGLRYLAAPAICWSVFLGTSAQAVDRPNVVLIMTDDQGYGDLSITGNPSIDTPNMDRLAREGVWLKRFYVSPVCTPTRASLMTGRYNYRTRAIDTYLGRAVMEPEEVTVAEVLRDAGYVTGIFGKWHLGDYYPTRPGDQGFTESLVHCGGGLRQPSNPPDGERYHDPILYHNGTPKRYEGYCTDIYFDEATRFITKSVQAKQPFFAYIATNAPHDPFDEPPTRELAEHFATEFPDDPKGAKIGFYAMIKNIDDNIGRLINTLDQLDIARNTLVIFLTDNGPSAGSAGPFRGKKGSAYEGGIRTVCFLRWPGVIVPGSSSDVPAAHIDLMPTILDFCNVPLPQGVRIDGRSVRPLIAEEGKTKTNQSLPDRYLFLQWHRGDVPARYHHFAAIDPQGRWKLVHESPSGWATLRGEPKFELYNLHEDPGEQNNLASQHPEKLAELKRAYEAWFDDVCSTRNPNFGMPPIVIGSEQAPTVILTPQDKRVDDADSAGWWANGYWPIDVRRTGPYSVKVLLTGNVQSDTTVTLQAKIGEATMTTAVLVPRGFDVVTVGNVVLPGTGLGRISAGIDPAGPESPRVYQITIK